VYRPALTCVLAWPVYCVPSSALTCVPAWPGLGFGAVVDSADGPELPLSESNLVVRDGDGSFVQRDVHGWQLPGRVGIVIAVLDQLLQHTRGIIIGG